ncbi:MAG TPA: helix-turn-helix transcriptional regulator [Candidatus Dormibacteraeota bacterium]
MSEPNVIGRQLKRLRNERGLTQAELAERAGVSPDLIAKLEQGTRQSARLTSVTRLAQALGAPVSELLDRRPRLDRAADAASLLAVRDALLFPSALPGIDPADDGGEATAPDQLRAAVREGWLHYWDGQFGRLATMLPGLIGEARLTVRVAGAEAASHLAQAYQLAACLNVHMGAEDLAAIGAERAVNAAAQGSDELQWATLQGTYSWVLLAQGRLDDAERHAAGVAQQIEPSLSTARPEHLTAWGALLLTALAPAAAAGRTAEAGEYISLARAGAARLDVDRHDYWTNFGPTQVAMQETHAYTVLGHPRRALRAAQGVRREDLLPISWGRYHLDVARAQLDSRRDGAALAALQVAHDTSAEWFRHQGVARSLVAELIDRRRRLPPALRALARSLDLGQDGRTPHAGRGYGSV